MMPASLVHAHQDLDRAVDAAYADDGNLQRLRSALRAI